MRHQTKFACLTVVVLYLLFATIFATAQEAGGPQDRDAESIREMTESVLSKPEYDRLRGLLDSNLVPEAGEQNDDETSSETEAPNIRFGAFGAAQLLGNLFVALAWVCVAAVVALMVFLVVKAIQAGRLDSASGFESSPMPLQGEIEPEHAPGELPADAYVEAARKLAAEGRFREAVAQLLLGAMSHIERAGWVRFRRGLTHRDYLRAIRAQEKPYLALREIVSTYEPLGFGRRVATGEHYTLSLQQYEVGFRALPQATTN